MPSPLSDERVGKILEGLTIRERLLQVEAWLREHHPTPYPTRVRVERIRQEKGWSIYGETYRDGRGGLTIRIHAFWKTKPWPELVAVPGEPHKIILGIAIETLIHEWAHAVCFPTVLMERAHARRGRRDPLGHTDEFNVVQGRILRELWDERGWRRAAGH